MCFDNGVFSVSINIFTNKLLVNSIFCETKLPDYGFWWDLIFNPTSKSWSRSVQPLFGIFGINPKGTEKEVEKEVEKEAEKEA